MFGAISFGVITFFIIVVVICGASLAMIIAGRRKDASAMSGDQSTKATVIPLTRSFQPPINTALLESLRQAEIGSLWVIHSINERGRRVNDLLVLGDLDERQLDALSRKDIVPFDRTFSLHRSILTNFMHRNNGPLARLADGEDIGWSATELIRKCHQWGIISGGVMETFRRIISSRPRKPGSTATEAAMARIEQILAELPTPAPASPKVRRESQIFSLSN